VTVEIPQYHELMWPALEAIRALGGSATIQEMDEWVIEKEHFPEEVQAIPHGDGRQTEIEYRLAWARTHLKGIVAIVNSKRGVWALTDRGRTISEQEVRADTRAWRAQFIRRHNERVRADEETGEIEEHANDEDWRDRLIRRLLNLEPAAFERLCQRLLREAGFVNVTITGRSGDGGIDGVGGVPPITGELPHVLSSEAVQGQRCCQCRPRLPRSHGRTRRQGLAGDYRELHP
jgi:restriction system protein